MPGGGDQDGRILLGRIVAAHGVRGEVLVRSYADTPENIGAYGPLMAPAAGRSVQLHVLRVTAKGVVARIAGIQAAKRASDWIPLAHPLPLDRVEVEFETVAEGVRIVSTVVATARTGAEMEAMVACSAAALSLYDMVKAVERGAVIGELRLEAKSGGRSGDWTRS